MNKARELALIGNYDFLLNIEDDIIIPENTIEILLDYYQKTKMPIISGLYRLWKNPHKLLCGKIAPKRLLYEQDVTAPIIELYLVCFGCILVHRKVLEKVQFDGTDGDFAQKTHRLGFKKILIPELKCGHVANNGEVVWP